MQCYYFSKPLPAEEIKQLLLEIRRLDLVAAEGNGQQHMLEQYRLTMHCQHKTT